MDKDRLYKEFKKPNSEIRILVSFDAIAHGVNVFNVDCSVQYCMAKDKYINITWQQFGRAACASG